MDIQLNDSTTLYVYNCKAWKNEESPELKAFLKYLETNSTETDFTRRIYKMVELKSTYFAWSLAEQDAIYKGMAEGLAKGRLEGEYTNKIENARNLLDMKVLTQEQIAKAVGLPIEKINELAQEANGSGSPDLTVQ